MKKLQIELLLLGSGWVKLTKRRCELHKKNLTKFLWQLGQILCVEYITIKTFAKMKICH